jgi:sugar phosphate isomerase/epimerase
MLRVLSTYTFLSRKLTPALLAEMEASGILAVELFCVRGHLNYRDEQEMRGLGDWVRDHDLKVQSLHAPTDRDSGQGHEGVPISISDVERVRRLDAVDEVKRALDLAEYFPFRYLVQHMGSSRDAEDPRKWDAAFSSLEHLVVFAKQRGVTIALENTPGEFATPANLRHFIEDTRLTNLRLCFDTGHAHIGEGVVPSFEAMREFVVTSHLHDNHGEKDEHLPPFQGTIDWPAALNAMSGALAGGLPAVLELKDQHPHTAPPEQTPAEPTLAAARAAFDKVEQVLGNARAQRAS